MCKQSVILYPLSFLILLFLSGCSTFKSPPAIRIGDGNGAPAYVIRVQSSYGDIQQIQVSVKEWQANGVDQPPFEQKMTPFEIPVYEGVYALRLTASAGGAELNVQIIENGQRLDYLQSKEVCVQGKVEGTYALQNCMTGLR